MPNYADITNIPAPRVDFIDPRTGLMAREWYRFFFNIFELVGGGRNNTSITDLLVGPPAINQVLGDLGIVYDQAQLAAMMAQYEQATKDLQNQLDTSPSLPQLGTMSEVNQDNVRLIGFATSPSPAVPNPAPTGTLYWDGNSTLGLQMNQSVLVRIGQAQFVYVKASSAITKGQLCKHTGSVGASGVITAAPTSTSMTDTTQIIGVAAQSIPLNDFGFIQTAGDIRGFDLTGTSVGEVWADGDPLYYNPSFVGSFTKTKPTAPNLKTYIGEIINAGSGASGSMNIHIVYGSTLGGTDSNVQFGTLSDKDLIQYDSTAQYWKNVAPSTIAIGSATNLAGGAAGSLPYQTGAGATSFLSIGTNNYVLTSNGSAPVWTANTGTGNVVRATSPSLTTPSLGAATCTTLSASSNISATNSWLFVRGNSINWPTTVVGQAAGRFCLAQSSGNTMVILHDDTAVAANTGPSGIYFTGRSNDAGPAYLPWGQISAYKENATQGNGDGYMVFKTSLGGTGLREALRIDSTANVLAKIGALGYGTGSGGSVTQITSRTTGVTLNKSNGAITLVSAAGTTSWQSFTVTNSLVAATDTVIVNQKSGTDKYMIHVTTVAAGSFEITFATTGGTTTEQPVFNFAVIKAVTA